MLEFEFADQNFVALPSGGLWMPKSRTLVVADLHLGKGQSFAADGNLLPPYDNRETLRRLKADIERWDPNRAVLVGDSFHHPDSADMLEDEHRELLLQLAHGREWIWITGNHDAQAFHRQHELVGTVVEHWTAAGIRFTHEPESIRGYHIFGHLHPKIRVQLQGRRISGKCFIVSDSALICPAYGAYTGGLWWPDEALTQLFQNPRFFLCHKEKVTAVRSSSLVM